ncbi:hypothetical protein ACFSYH_02060 [Populibacterium corticicola]|uniref:XRE family transcriptional regulator n=1 Tax=Populibacterium corticicola TaxID=1812826 RepID=A0ABW5XAN2_9MICO
MQPATRDLFEDIDWMLETGEAPHRIADRVGRNPEAIARLAARHGRTDIARTFQALYESIRRHATPARKKEPA